MAADHSRYLRLKNGSRYVINYFETTNTAINMPKQTVSNSKMGLYVKC